MDFTDDRPLNAALLEAVDFIQAEGWDRPATLFALVPRELVADALELTEEDSNPLALVVQDDVPDHIRPGSEELGEFISSIRWPQAVVGAILAQEIRFIDSSLGEDATPRDARLFSGILDGTAHGAGPGADRTLIQLDRKSTRLNSSHYALSRMPSSA